MSNFEDSTSESKNKEITPKAVDDEIWEIFVENDVVQGKLADLLYELTKMGKAEWVRCKANPNFFTCFVNNEKIEVEKVVTEVIDEDKKEKSYIVSYTVNYRDAEFNYFGKTCNIKKIIEILEVTPINPDKYQKLNKSWLKHWESHLLDDLTEYRNSLPKSNR